MSLKSMFKGWVGEVFGVLSKKIKLDPKVYFDINNVTIPAKNGTTQIDHIIVSRFGIFVIEAKNMKGWIYGSVKSPKWTQSVFGKKYSFQNPLHQNYRHIKALTEFLDIEEEKFHSVVMFWGESKFKTDLPENVLDTGYSAYIKSKQVVYFDDAEVQQILDSIKTGSLPKTWKTRREHVQGLKDRFSSDSICPKCGKELVLRIAKNGKNAGSSLYGCSGFPICRYTRTG